MFFLLPLAVAAASYAAGYAVGYAVGSVLIKLHCKILDNQQIKEWQKDKTLKEGIKCICKTAHHCTLEDIEGTTRYEIDVDEDGEISNEIKQGEIYNYC